MTAPPRGYVVDASVGIKLFLPEEFSDDVERLFDAFTDDTCITLQVPDLFYVECANILWKQVRRGEYQAAQARRDLESLVTLRIPSTPMPALVGLASDIACTHDITAYDASYVALSQLAGLPLLTADERLVRKLAGTAYAVVPLAQLAAAAG